MRLNSGATPVAPLPSVGRPPNLGARITTELPDGYRAMLIRVLALILIAFAVGSSARAEDFPKDLVEWTSLPSSPVFQGTGNARGWDRKIRERGWILVVDGVYHLWYTGYNDDRSPNRSLGYAISVDGLSWIRYPSNPIVTSSWVEDVCVVKHDGGYQMFAEGEQDVAHRLTSTDRVHWKEEGPLDIRKVDGSPIVPGPYGTPVAFFEDGVWSLLYERADRGVWLAKSTDLKTWTHVQDEPVLTMGPSDYDRYAIAFDQVLKRDGVYYAIYHANAHNPWKKDWTTCIARSKDLIHWEKYAGNPLVKNDSSSGQLVPLGKGFRLYTMHPEVRVLGPK